MKNSAYGDTQDLETKDRKKIAAIIKRLTDCCTMMKRPPIDSLIKTFDISLRILSGVGKPKRARPTPPLEGSLLSDSEKTLSARLMRVNHCGEICAQALYLGQGLTSKDRIIQQKMQRAAQEERDHLLWCESRLNELNASKSVLNPVFYLVSFLSGAVMGSLSSRLNLGFVAATEEQVIIHLDEHLKELPFADTDSKAILEQMKHDENEHKTEALANGGIPFPKTIKAIMTAASNIMTKTTYWM